MIIDGGLKIGDQVVWRSTVEAHNERFMRYLHEVHGDGPFTVESIKPKKFTVCLAGSSPDPKDTHDLTVSSNGKVLVIETGSNRPAEFSSYWFEKAPS